MFHTFHQQLGHSVELDNMKRLRTILRHPATQSALNRAQQVELRWLIMRLVKESPAVIQRRRRPVDLSRRKSVVMMRSWWALRNAR